MSHGICHLSPPQHARDKNGLLYCSLKPTDLKPMRTRCTTSLNVCTTSAQRPAQRSRTTSHNVHNVLHNVHNVRSTSAQRAQRRSTSRTTSAQRPAQRPRTTSAQHPFLAFKLKHSIKNLVMLVLILVSNCAFQCSNRICSQDQHAQAHHWLKHAQAQLMHAQHWPRTQS